jgi:hypothetical protein
MIRPRFISISPAEEKFEAAIEAERKIGVPPKLQHPDDAGRCRPEAPQRLVHRA